MGVFIPEREYWSERRGSGPAKEPLSLETLKKLLFSTFDEFFVRDYFQQALGYMCVDEGQVAGAIGSDPEAWFLRVLNREDVWPYRKHGDAWDSDTVFDVTEVLYDSSPSRSLDDTTISPVAAGTT